MPEPTVNPNNFERTKELTDRLEAGIKDLFQSDKYKDYLKTMSHFHHYSTRNIMLIKMQYPGATRVASYNLWKDKFNRQVKKGESGIRIFAPIKEKEPEKKLMEKLDPETGAPLFDKDGKVIMEEMTALASGIKFKLVPVFDLSQTWGDPLPQLAENLTGNVEHYTAFMDALKKVSPLPVEFEPLRDGHDGYCRFGEKIGIRDSMSEAQTVSAVIHEIVHARLHDREKATENAAPKSKNIKEVEAESVSFVTAAHFGIETSPNSFGYLAEYGSRDMSELKASLDTIRKEANSLINDIEYKFMAVCKERGIDLSAKEPEKPAAPVTPPEPEFTTETRTETVAGVDFEVTDIIPQMSVQENETVKNPFSPEELKEMEIYQFAADYVSYITDTYNTSGRMGDKETENSINGIASIILKGNINGIREALERAAVNSDFPEKSAELLERLNTMFPQTAVIDEAAKTPPENITPDENMPDRAIGIAEMNMYGYEYEGILPLTQEKALELYDKDQPVYLLYSDNTEAMAIDRSDIEMFGGIFGIDRDVWERTLEYTAASAKNSEAAKESGLIHGNTDTFGIYQVKEGDDTRKYRFASLEELETNHLAVDRSNYELVYTAPLPPKETLEGLYQQFNVDHPKDFTGRSVSVSDVIVIQRGGDVTSHFVDRFGFAELPAFLGNERQPERNAPITENTEFDNKGTPPLFDAEPIIQQKDDKSVSDSENTVNKKVYMQSPDHARTNGELDKYRASLRLNKECGETIDGAIKECVVPNAHGYRLTPESVSKVMDVYGEQRMSVVLANTVRLQDWDGRYSKDTRDWANRVEIPQVRDKRDFFSNAHPAVLDGYIRLVRKEIDARDKKPSILDALKQGSDKIRQDNTLQKELPQKNKKGQEV